MATILIVDDDPACLELAADFVAGNGHTTLKAATAREALERIAKDEPDLVLLDYQMPDLDGTQVLTLLRLDPTTKSLPVIFLSGLAPEHYSGLTEPDNLVRFLDKPIDRDALVDAIASLLPPKKN